MYPTDKIWLVCALLFTQHDHNILVRIIQSWLGRLGRVLSEHGVSGTEFGVHIREGTSARTYPVAATLCV